MSAMRLHLDQIEGIYRDMARELQRLRSIRDQLLAVSRQVDPAIKRRRNIDARLRHVNQSIAEVERELERLTSFIQQSVTRYRDMEANLARRSASIGDMTRVTLQGSQANHRQDKPQSSLSPKRSLEEIKKIREELLAQGVPQHIVDYYHPLPKQPEDPLLKFPVTNANGEVMKVVNLFESVAYQVIGGFYEVEGEHYFITADGQKLKVDWDAAVDWIRAYNDRHPLSVDNILIAQLSGPQDIPIWALKMMQEDGYDVRTFANNGDPLINVSYIALREAEEVAEQSTMSANTLRDIWKGTINTASIVGDLSPIGTVKGIGEGIAGYDIAGNSLSPVERAMGILGPLGVVGKMGRRVFKYFRGGGKNVDEVIQGAQNEANRYQDVLPSTNRGNSSIDQHTTNNGHRNPNRDHDNMGIEGTGNLKPQGLMEELATSGVKYNPNDVVAVTKTPDGKLVWLENGNSQAGLNHILKHADEFATKGISQNQLPEFITKAVSEGKIVGYQGKGTGDLSMKLTLMDKRRELQ